MQTLYFDCFAGASGNMILGGLIALGVEREALVAKLKGLAVADFSVDVSTVERSGISSTHVKVNVPDEKEHRHLKDVERIIDDSDLSEKVKRRSKAIFRRLAEAEARVHGIDIQKVHFHEVGALDAIVDVVGSCVGFEMLGIERFVCSKIHLGSGFVRMAHGTYPVPPPAVANLLQGVPVYSTDVEGELITPTGAAIISTLCDSYGPLPEIIVERSGYGAGTREYEDFPNVLRMMIGTSAEINVQDKSEKLIEERLVLLETNVDDMSAQVVGFVLDRALEIGAMDCWITAVQMKKNRPASLISVLCNKEKERELMKMLFMETTTLGVRSRQVERFSLPREVHSVQTKFGVIEVKTATYMGNMVNVMPEYEQVKRVALEHGVPFRQVHAEAILCFKGRAATSVART